MNVGDTLSTVGASIGAHLPKALLLLGIVLGGWILAIALRAAVRHGLKAIDLNRRLASTGETDLDVESGAATGIYYIVLLMVAAAVLAALDLEVVSEPLQALTTPLFAFVPKLVIAAVLGLAGWFLAGVLRSLATAALARTSLDEKLSDQAGMRPVSANLGSILYWFVILLTLVLVLDALQFEGLLQPVQDILSAILGALPNILGAVIIGVVGWFLARILRDITTSVLSAAGVDRFGTRMGLRDDNKLSKVFGLVVQVFVFVPALVEALNKLQIEAVSKPATGMLETLLAAVPNILAAAIILMVAWFLARFVTTIAQGLLSGVGFDELPGRLGLLSPERKFELSDAVGKLIYLVIMLLAVAEAARQVGFEQVSDLVATFLDFGADVLLGTIILLVGFMVANLARDAIARVGGSKAGFMASLARVAILGLVIAMGLRAMGLADDIVNMAFGFTFGAVAVAFALAFGLGGREAAGKLAEHWLARLRE